MKLSTLKFLALPSLAAIAPLLFLLVSSPPAMASFVHRDTSGGRNRVVIPNQTPNTTITLTVGTTEIRPVSPAANTCGIARLQDSATNPIVGIEGVNFVGRTTEATVPSGYTPTGLCSDSLKPAGSVVKVGNAYYIWFDQYGTFNLQVSYGKVSNVKVNSCGFGSIAITPTRPLTNFSSGGVAYTLASLPIAANGFLYCRKTGGVAITYRTLQLPPSGRPSG